MKFYIAVYILIIGLLSIGCVSPVVFPASPTNTDPTTDACHIDPQSCATLTPAPESSHTPTSSNLPTLELSPTAAPPALPSPVIHEQPGPIYDIVIQIPVGEDGILYRGAGVEDMEPVGPNGLVVTPEGVFIIGDVNGNRLMRYDAGGNRLDDIDLTSLGILNISDLVGAGDALYILEISFKVLPERYRINQLTTSGELVRQYNLPKGYHLENGLYGLAIGYTAEGESQVLVQSGAGAGSLYYRIPDSAEKPPEALPALPVYGKSLRREDANPGEMASLVIDGQMYESQMTAGGTIALLSARADGSLYLQREDLVSWDPVITTDITIHYISPERKPIGVARYPLMDWYFHLWRFLTVGPDGNVYGLITREKSVDVLRLNFYQHLDPILSEAVSPAITGIPSSLLLETEYDCTQVERLSLDSPEAQLILEEFLENFHRDWPTEYMGFEQVWSVDRLGEYAVIQGMVTAEESDILLVQQTERGYFLVGRYAPSQTQSDLQRAEIAAYFGERVPEAPPELFYCLDFREFIGEPISPDATPPSEPENKALILYTSYPGDGGGCMADYLGYMAPSFILYADGQLLIENPHTNPYWYSEYHLDQKTITGLFTQIENTGFFSVGGDGSEDEHDPIYRLPQDVEVTHGAGFLSLEVQTGGSSKKVMIYIPYIDYLVPEIANAIEIINNHEPINGAPYQPSEWAAWVGTEDPCEPYMFDFKPWPETMPEIHSHLNDDHGQLVFQNDSKTAYNQLLGSQPETFIHEENGFSFYIISRPLSPHELPSDFIDWK